LSATSPAAAQAAPPAPRGAVTYTPWAVVGCSRSAWYRALSTGEAPAGITLPGSMRRC
jgi:hypothetical protein